MTSVLYKGALHLGNNPTFQNKTQKQEMYFTKRYVTVSAGLIICVALKK